MGQHLISEGDLTYTVELTHPTNEQWRGSSWAVDAHQAMARVLCRPPGEPSL